MLNPHTMGRGLVQPLHRLWQQRWLAWGLLTRELGNRYAGSVMGTAWALVHPVLMLALYAVLFVAVFKVKLPATQDAPPFVVYMAVAMWPWLAFSEGLSRGAMAVVNNGALVRKVAFERALLVYAAVSSAFVVHMAGFALVLVLLVASGVSLHLALLPVVVWAAVVLWLLATGIAMVLAGVQVFARDVEQLLGQVLAMGFYLTPIVYPMSLVPAWLAQAVVWNPLVHVIEPMRQALLYGHWPDASNVLGMLGLGMLLLAVGHAVFARLSPHFEDAL